ncbi:MAG: hypothetical protein GF404_00120 [candidate division Zixibacteria bacterium]|nr:hypothetical protein [candidate division Zixibacteria bacterium]
MKKLILAVTGLFLVFGLYTPASSQFYMSAFGDARVVEPQQFKLGGGILISDDVMGLGGAGKYGLADGLEGSFRLGMVKIDPNDHTGLTFGAHIMHQMLDVEFGDGVDIAIGGGAEYYSVGEDASLWMFGGNGIISYPFELSGGQIFSPFFRLNLRFDRVSANDNSDTDFEFGFGFGSEFDISEKFGLFAEVIIPGGDLDEAFVGGINFTFGTY